jgi:hypothetical protein
MHACVWHEAHCCLAAAGAGRVHLLICLLVSTVSCVRELCTYAQASWHQGSPTVEAPYCGAEVALTFFHLKCCGCHLLSHPHSVRLMKAM